MWNFRKLGTLFCHSEIYVKSMQAFSHCGMLFLQKNRFYSEILGQVNFFSIEIDKQIIKISIILS